MSLIKYSFYLGTAVALRLNTGFLALRKGGMLCVDTDIVDFTDYQSTGKKLEIRTNPFPKGKLLILCVDSNATL